MMNRCWGHMIYKIYYTTFWLVGSSIAWKISSDSSDDVYILQRININVFKQPENIAANIKNNIAGHLHKNNPGISLLLL